MHRRALTCALRAILLGTLTTFLVTVGAGSFSGDAPGALQKQGAHPGAAALIGTWRLVSFETQSAVGEVRRPFGRAPRGLLQYDAAGHMSVQVMNSERPRFTSDDLLGGSDAEVRAAMAGYLAYFGTYTVDLPRGIVTYHLEGALFPNWIGGNQVRYFRHERNRLTLTTPPIRMGGEESKMVVV
jgi:hypothetical protein